MTKNILAFLILIALWSCSGSGNEKAATSDSNETAAAESTALPKGKYEIRSGIVVYKTSMMGMDMEQTIYFNDFGAKESQETSIDVMGTKTDNIVIHEGNTTYAIDLVKRTGKKVTSANDPSTVPDLRNLSDELKKEMNFKELGNENFLGKVCKKISIDYTAMDMKGVFLVYKGVALKSEMKVGTMPVTMQAVKFDENATIPAEKFEVPPDIRFN